MKHINVRPLKLSFACLIFLFGVSLAAFADNPRDRTHFGHNINIGPDEEASEVTCFGCSVHVQGHVAGDVTTFGGNIVVDDHGQIAGDVTMFGGSLRVHKEGAINGDASVFGGRISRDPGATISGEITNMAGAGWVFLIFVAPIIVFALFVWFIVWLIRRLLRPSIPVTA
jgi:hypothetical protein